MNARLLRALRVASSLLFAAGVWAAAAPPSIGGRTTLVQVSGRSMEPALHGGDLVVVRRSGSGYDVGDVVAYHADDVLVIHRIVGTDGGRYVLQGDNKPRRDPWRPADADIVGEVVAHAAGARRWLTLAADPVVLGAAAGSLVFAAVAAGGGQREGRPRVRGRSGSRPATPS